jgi:hypothetical protein
VKILSDDELFDLLGPEPEKLPWRHQEKEFDEHRDDRCRVYLWTMRSGKSKAVIDKAEYQFAKNAIEGVVVLAPNGIHLNWILNEIPRWSWPFNEYMAFGWETPKRADWSRIDELKNFEAYHDGIRYLTVNMEALSHLDCIRTVRRFIKSCRGKIMLVISEAHHFGRAGAKRTNLARNLGRNAKFVTLETGTALLNSPLRAYSIYKILDNFALGPEYAGDTYEKFARHFAEWEIDPNAPSYRAKRRRYKTIKGYKNLDELRDKMAPWSSVVTRDDIEGMPELLRTERIVVMSEIQRRAYLEMVSRHLVEIGENMVTAKDGGARVQKLQQILNGYVKDGDRIIEIDPNAPIYDALVDEVVGTFPENSIVWCRYREDIRRVCKRLKRERIPYLEFHGGIPVGKREKVRLEFQNSDKPVVLVGHPAAGGEGLDFSRAHAIIHFSSTPNAIHVNQGEERGTEKWGHPVTLVRIRTPGTVDDRNWAIVDGKTTVADDLSGRGLRDLLMRTDV